jgi:uncharacterized protein (DUF885 family)
MSGGVSQEGLLAPMSSDFASFVEVFLTTIWRDQPPVATSMGAHEYDHQLGDYSAAGWEARLRHLAELERRAAGIDPGLLSPGERLDRQLSLGFTRLSQAVAAARPPWKLSPELYASLPADSLFPLIVREFAPLPERARSVLSRLRQVPEALAAGRQTLATADGPQPPARVHTETALEMAAGSAQFLRTVIPALAEAAPELAAGLRDAAEEAVEALSGFARFLEEELLPRSTGAFAVGRELFDRMLAEEHALDLNADDLDRIGREAIRQTKAELEEVAAEVELGVLWAGLVERARGQHVATPEEVRPAYEAAMERARQFVIDHDLVTLPEQAFSLEIIDTPEFLRPIIPYAAYMPAAPFESEQKGFFVVTPIDTGAPPELARRQLEGHNRYHMEVVALHEAYPGHHLQLVRANAHPSRLRRFFTNTTFCEGWALYCEQLMRELGFNEGGLGHLMQLRDQLWRACRVVVDAGLHAGEMTVEEAVRLLVEEARLEEPNAVAEVKRYTMSPTQPMSYLIGKREIMRLRDDDRARTGDRFTLRGFHDALLSHGTIPPAYVRQEMFAG